VIQDLDKTNLTDLLCTHQTPEQLRKTMHRLHGSVRLFFLKLSLGIMLLVLVIQAIVWCVLVFGFGVFDKKPAQLNLLQPVAYNTAQQDDTASNASVYLPAIDKLEQAVLRQYSYYDLRGVDWPARFKEFSPKLQKCKSDQEFVDGIADLMSAAKDVHVWIDFNGKRVATFQAKTQSKFNPRALPKVLKSFQQHGTTVITGEATPEVKYVLIATWDHREPAAFRAAQQAIEQAVKSNSSLIIDVRPNAGGDERQAQAIAGLFTDKTLAYAASRPWKDGKPGPTTQRILEPNKAGQKHAGRCLILMGPSNMSSCESFLRMMRAAGVKLVGATTMGTSGNPQPHDVGRGIRIYLPSWQQLDLQGNLIEGVGIEPDFVVESKPSDFAQSDPVLRRAVERISQQQQ
jgi:carboxyl-terminal processing protease